MRFDFAFHGNRTHSIFVTTPAGAASRAPAENFSGAPLLAIIIDDLGRDPSAARSVLALPFPLTASVLPNLQYSAEVADQAYRRGDHVILHLPMEAESAIRRGAARGHRAARRNERGPGTLDPREHARDGSARRRRQQSRRLARHRRSRPHGRAHARDFARRIFTSSTAAPLSPPSPTMQREPRACPQRRARFFSTTSKRAKPSSAPARPCRARRPSDGSAIAIGHPHPVTIAALDEGLPRLRAEGIRIVFASELVH